MSQVGAGAPPRPGVRIEAGRTRRGGPWGWRTIADCRARSRLRSSLVQLERNRMLKHLTRTHTGAMKAHHASVSDTGGTSTARRSRASRHASNLRRRQRRVRAARRYADAGSSQGVQESNGTAQLKLVALLDNHPVMRMFTMFRSRGTPHSPTSPSSTLGQERPREPVDWQQHL